MERGPPLFKRLFPTCPFIFYLHCASHAQLDKVYSRFNGAFLGRWEFGVEKPHLVRWDIVCFGQEARGFRNQKSFHLNKALLSKCIWRSANGRAVLWNQVINRKYGEEDRAMLLRGEGGVC